MTEFGREHKCSCGNEWITEIKLSESTQNLSGEETPWCVKCGRRAMMSGPPRKFGSGPGELFVQLTLVYPNKKV